MSACLAWGYENRDGAKFCEECAAPLSAPARPDEALAALNEARDLFAELGAAPALAETDALWAKLDL